MKKKLIMILSIFFCIFYITTIVKAESLEYEWKIEVDDDFRINKVYKFENGYFFDGATTKKFYDKQGILIKENNERSELLKTEDGMIEVVDKYIDYISGIGSKYEITFNIYSNNMELIETKSFEKVGWSYTNLLDEIEDYYVIVGNYNKLVYTINKKTMEVKEISINSNEDITNYYSNKNKFLHNLSIENEDKYYYEIKELNGYKLAFYTNESDYNIELYDFNDEFVHNFNLGKRNIGATLSDDGIYIATNVEIDPTIGCPDEDRICRYQTAKSKLVITKYDFNGNEIYSQELNELISGKQEYSWGYGRYITDVEKTEDGLVIVTNYDDGSRSLTPSIDGSNPVILKYYFAYDIETKTDGNGEIKIESTSKPGEEVTYEVIPKEGYALGTVKVTDKDGNIIELEENKFTMPSSDVLIEATFIKEDIKNPETKDIAIIIILISLISGAFLVIYNHNKLKFLK